MILNTKQITSKFKDPFALDEESVVKGTGLVCLEIDNVLMITTAARNCVKAYTNQDNQVQIVYKLITYSL